MAFRIHDVSIHLMPAGISPQPCTHMSNTHPAEKPCTGHSCNPSCAQASAPNPPNPKKQAPKVRKSTPVKPPKKKALAFLRAQLREALAPARL